MTVRVDVSPRALRHIDAALDWWRRNRDKAPSLLIDELEEAFDIIRLAPEAGRYAATATLRGVRRLQLPKTRYTLYYQVRSRGHARVIALTHQSRGGTTPS